MIRCFAVSVCVTLAATSAVVADTYEYADTSGFRISGFPSGTTPTQFAFPAAGGPIAMTRTTTANTGLSLTTRTVTYSGSSPYNNPDWITGTRNFFGIVDSGSGATPIITLTSGFASPLQTNAFLVFTDVEFGERIYIKAFNGASLIPFGDLTFAKWNGGSTSGMSVNTTWNSETGYSGLLLSGTPFGFSNPVVTLQSSQPISSLEYTIDMGSAANSLGFNFAVPVPVPEPSTIVLAASAGIVATTWLRRLRERIGDTENLPVTECRVYGERRASAATVRRAPPRTPPTR